LQPEAKKMSALDDKNGFTLIEILIATVIITVASLGVASLTVGIMRGNSYSSRLTTATTLVQDRLEQVRRIGYANAMTALATENYGSITNFNEYKRVTSISNDSPSSNMKTIFVEVLWDNDKHNIKIGTILAE
jgi:type IV pilus assembly protein PilV